MPMQLNISNKLKIKILVPCWKRPEITEICFRGLQRLINNPSVDVTALAIISETEYEGLAKRYKIPTTFFVNTPLGRKKNHGLQVALKSDWDYLMELNSDDLISDDLIKVYLPFLKQGVDYLGIENFCLLNSETGELRQYSSKTVYGIGRCYSRGAILKAARVQPIIAKETAMGDFSTNGYMVEGDKLDVKPGAARSLILADFAKKDGREKYKLWNDKAEIGMDNYSDIIFNRAGITCKHLFTEKPLAVDIKSKVNLHGFTSEVGQPYDLKEFLEEFSGDERAMIINLLRKNNVEYS